MAPVLRSTKKNCSISVAKDEIGMDSSDHTGTIVRPKNKRKKDNNRNQDKDQKEQDQDHTFSNADQLDQGTTNPPGTTRDTDDLKAEWSSDCAEHVGTANGKNKKKKKKRPRFIHSQVVIVPGNILVKTSEDEVDEEGEVEDEVDEEGEVEDEVDDEVEDEEEKPQLVVFHEMEDALPYNGLTSFQAPMLIPKIEITSDGDADDEDEDEDTAENNAVGQIEVEKANEPESIALP